MGSGAVVERNHIRLCCPRILLRLSGTLMVKRLITTTMLRGGEVDEGAMHCDWRDLICGCWHFGLCFVRGCFCALFALFYGCGFGCAVENSSINRIRHQSVLFAWVGRNAHIRHSIWLAFCKQKPKERIRCLNQVKEKMERPSNQPSTPPHHLYLSPTSASATGSHNSTTHLPSAALPTPTYTHRPLVTVS